MTKAFLISYSMHRRMFLAMLLMLSGCLYVFAQSDGFSSSLIPDSVFMRMQGRSWPASCKMRRSDLRFLSLRHFDEHGVEKRGEMICHKSIAPSLLAIFRELYALRYPIHSIRLVDDFNADDRQSMEANNTSCFNYRLTTNGALSRHARGMAVDINPLWNPCVHLQGRNKGMVEPVTSKPFLKRDATMYSKGFRIISPDDECYKLFIRHGFRWGGAWRSMKDYQHFEK